MQSIMSLSCLIFIIERTLSDHHDYSAPFSTQNAPIWSITLLSYLIFTIGHSLFNWVWQFNSVFGIDRTSMIVHVVVLLEVIDRTLSNRSWQFSFIFSIDHTCTIGHVVVLSLFLHRLHHFGSIMSIQLRFRHRLHRTISHVIVLSHFRHRPLFV